MKRTLAIILVLVLCFQFFGMEASAAEAGISLSSAEGLPGEQVSVNVKITGNTGLAYLKIKVAYDSSALTLISAENTGLLGGTYTTSKTTDVNPYVLQWMAAGNSVGDGIIATLTFEINETAVAGNQTISLLFEECYDEEFNDVAFTPAAGVVTITKPACDHVWDDGKVTTPAGCETTGVRTYTCTIPGCGETKTETIPANGHSFGEWKVTKAATCTEKGVETRECACGEKETREIAATGHKYGEWKVTKAATCTEKGVETRECACGEKEARDVAATGHKYGEWKVTKAASCTEKGEETRECTCGEKETREIAANGHALNTYGKDSTHHWALCDNCDYVGEKEAHSYDYNGVCECGATKPVEVDPDLDDVPKTGDITPYIVVISVVFLIAVATAAAFVLKRKATK